MKQAGCSSTDHGGGKRRGHQAADWISPRQCCTHRVVEIGIGEAAVELQPRKNPIKEDAALLERYAGCGGPDGPKLRIGEGEHATMVLPTRWMSIAIAHDGA